MDFLVCVILSHFTLLVVPLRLKIDFHIDEEIQSFTAISLRAEKKLEEMA
jgi:hypothetical protein